jgi:hypothetical protein
MFKRLACIAALICAASSASAGVYITERSAGAHLWVLITTSGIADCYIYAGDLRARPGPNDIWVFPTKIPAAAHKVIAITNSRAAADDLSCLVKK